jgi:hypothetical protein
VRGQGVRAGVSEAQHLAVSIDERGAGGHPHDDTLLVDRERFGRVLGRGPEYIQVAEVGENAVLPAESAPLPALARLGSTGLDSQAPFRSRPHPYRARARVDLVLES